MEYITTKEAKKGGGAGKGLQSVAADSSHYWGGMQSCYLLVCSCSCHMSLSLDSSPHFFVFQIIVHFSFFHLNKIYQISYVPAASQNRCVKI